MDSDMAISFSIFNKNYLILTIIRRNKEGNLEIQEWLDKDFKGVAVSYKINDKTIEDEIERQEFYSQGLDLVLNRLLSHLPKQFVLP